MLNELFDLASSIPDGFSLEKWHPAYKALPKISQQKPCYFIYISNSGIKRIERTHDEVRIATLKKWHGPNNTNNDQFPSFNIRPLLSYSASDNDELFKKVKKLKGDRTRKQAPENIRSIVDDINIHSISAWDAKDIVRIDRCLHLLPQQLLEATGDIPKDYSALETLISRVEKLPSQQFHEQLLSHAVNACYEAPFDYLPILLHFVEIKTSNTTVKRPGNSISVVLEIAEGTAKFEYPVQHSQVCKWINERLLEDEAIAQDDNNIGVDAFGLESSGWDAKLPEVRLPVLGGVKLRAMNAESPCQRRYGQIDSKSFVIGKPARERMKSAMEWLTQPGFEGKTWCNVSSVADTKELLIVYPSVLPDVPAPIAGMFGGTLSGNHATEAVFAESAARVTGMIKAIPKPLNELDIRVFALRKMDKARTQVSCDHSYCAERLLEAAELWQLGCQNLPPMEVGFFPDGEKQPTWIAPSPLFPLEAIGCLNTVWSHQATRAERVKVFTAADAIALLFEAGDLNHQLAQRMLGQLLINSKQLVIAVSQTQSQGRAFTTTKSFSRQSRIVPSLLALLLSKQGNLKESYMKSPTFLVGELLTLADQLHFQYCQQVRDKRTPPQLLGNALMNTALESPERGLALFSQRVLPYQGWAKTYSGENAGLAHYLLSQMGTTCAELAAINDDIPSQTNDKEKAAMLLGYLAKSRHVRNDNEEVNQGDMK